MIAPLSRAERDRVRDERAAAYEQQDFIVRLLRNHEINMGESVKMSNAIVWPRWSRHSIGPCMPGCVEQHSEADAVEDTVHHRVTVGTVPSTQPDGSVVTVDWGFVDDLPEGTRSDAEIIVSGADDGVGPEQARQLANLLGLAAEQVERWNRQQPGGRP